MHVQGDQSVGKKKLVKQGVAFGAAKVKSR
jgi:hypothetical protein